MWIPTCCKLGSQASLLQSLWCHPRRKTPLQLLWDRITAARDQGWCLAHEEWAMWSTHFHTRHWAQWQPTDGCIVYLTLRPLFGLAVVLLFHSIWRIVVSQRMWIVFIWSWAARYAASGTLQRNESNRGHWLSSETERTASSSKLRAGEKKGPAF